MIANCLHAEITTKLYNNFFWLYAPDTHTTRRLKRSSMQITAEYQYKLINCLQGRFSKSLRYPEKQLNWKLMTFLFLNLLVVCECSASAWTYYKWNCWNTWKNLCFLFLPLVLNDSCGQHLSSKNVYTLKIIKVNLLFCFAML